MERLAKISIAGAIVALVLGLSVEAPRILGAAELAQVRGAETFTCGEDIGGADCIWWNFFQRCPVGGVCIRCEDTTSLADSCVQSALDNCVEDEVEKDCKRVVWGACEGSVCEQTVIPGPDCDDMTNCHDQT